MPLALLLVIVFFASFILTMVGLGGGLIFSPLFILLKFVSTLGGVLCLYYEVNYLRITLFFLVVFFMFFLCFFLSFVNLFIGEHQIPENL